VTTTSEFEGWPCISAAEDYHKTETENDGSCRTGYCFFVSDEVDLNIKVKDSSTYSYLISATLLPGFNFLSWCKESVLVNGGVIGDVNKKTLDSTTPEFSLLLCCKGMALTYRPDDPSDPTSPYVTSSKYHPMAYKLKDHLYPPSLTVLSGVGSVPSLLLLARVAGGGRGLMFERMTGLVMDESLAKTTFHSLANKVQY
jgi:hypothetical protein